MQATPGSWSPNYSSKLQLKWHSLHLPLIAADIAVSTASIERQVTFCTGRVEKGLSFCCQGQKLFIILPVRD